MKRMTVILLLAMLMLVSCTDKRIAEFEQMEILYRCGYYKSELVNYFVDLDNIEAVTETATQIVLCRVDSREMVMYDPEPLTFKYEIEILDILMDINGKLEVGDRAVISSNEGFIKASELDELAKKQYSIRMLIRRLESADIELTENGYIMGSMQDAIPIEVGRTYIMYLRDDMLEVGCDFRETSRQYLYEYVDDRVYWKVGVERHELSRDELIEEIRGQIAARTGRVEEIGYDAYLDELGERQAAEYRARVEEALK